MCVVHGQHTDNPPVPPVVFPLLPNAAAGEPYRVTVAFRTDIIKAWDE
jgi:hypothetical protein